MMPALNGKGLTMTEWNTLTGLLDGIDFNLIAPEDPGLVMVTTEATGIDIDVKNTILPEAYDPLKVLLQPLCAGVNRMSTFAIAAIVNASVRCMPADCSYVNVGVWNGFTLLSGMVGNEGKRCVGIDNFSEFGGPREKFLANFNQLKSAPHAFFEMDYRDYFETIHRGPIGVYYYDGDHSEENQYMGLKAAEPFLSDDAIIVIDDINDRKAIEGTKRYLSETNLTFNVLKHVETAHNNHPTYWNGLIVLQRTIHA
jgi:hypothetical protein